MCYLKKFLIFIILFKNVICVLYLVPNGPPEECPGKTGKGIGSIIDLSNVDIIEINDYEMQLTGNFTPLVQFDTGSIQIYLTSERNQGNQWKEFKLKRFIPDLCSVLFNRFEPWYDLVKDFEGPERVCPPPQNTIYNMRDKIVKLQLPDTPIYKIQPGEYRIQLNIRYHEKTKGEQEGCFRAKLDVKDEE